jgi:hypothetical protein
MKRAMHRTFIVLLICFPTLAHGATQAPESRWEGPIQITGREPPLIVDLARRSRVPERTK